MQILIIFELHLQSLSLFIHVLFLAEIQALLLSRCFWLHLLIGFRYFLTVRVNNLLLADLIQTLLNLFHLLVHKRLSFQKSAFHI